MYNVQSSIYLLCICISILITTLRVADGINETIILLPESLPVEKLSKDEMKNYVRTKSQLRFQLKIKLSRMTLIEKVSQSKLITKKLLNHPLYKTAKRIAVYIHTDTEVATREIIEDIFETKRECFVPKYDKSNMLTMLKVKSIEDLDSLPITKLGIAQPADGDVREDAMLTGGLDLIIVPGLGFTEFGKRLGHGRGCYDRFLEKYDDVFPKNLCMSVGLAFDEQLVEDIPYTYLDQFIHYVFTPDDYLTVGGEDDDYDEAVPYTSLV